VLLGIKVGKRFFARAFPSIVLDAHSSIELGDDVILKGRVEIRALNGAHVLLASDVKLDTGIRIVATNAAEVSFFNGADIGCYSIFNCGANFSIGRDSLVAGFCYFQTSDHNFKSKDCIIKNQGYKHGSIYIGDDTWIAGGSFILSGVKIENGCVIGANSVVNKSLPLNAIVVGSPAKIIGIRG
jgi:acetyltransferase-like isoleucine patch superfamily enzyme